MMRVESTNKRPHKWHDLHQLIEILLPVVRDAYADAELLILKDLRMSDRVYLLRDQDRVVHGFLMAGFDHPANVSLPERRPAYMGLSAVRPSARGTGNCLPLYRAFIRDGQLKEAENGCVYLIWATTASRTVWNLFSALLNDVAPIQGKPLTQRQIEWASAIRASMRSSHPQEPEDPFYWPDHKPDIRYSPAEWQRIQNETGGFPYGDFTVDERRGDRLLMIGHLPSPGTAHAGSDVVQFRQLPGSGAP